MAVVLALARSRGRAAVRAFALTGVRALTVFLTVDLLLRVPGADPERQEDTAVGEILDKDRLVGFQIGEGRDLVVDADLPKWDH